MSIIILCDISHDIYYAISSKYVFENISCNFGDMISYTHFVDHIYLLGWAMERKKLIILSHIYVVCIPCIWNLSKSTYPFGNMQFVYLNQSMID